MWLDHKDKRPGNNPERLEEKENIKHLYWSNLEGLRADPVKDYDEVKVSLDGPDASSQESEADATQL